MPGYPLGREATASPGGPDLRFADDTRYGVLVQARVVGGRLTVTLWSRRTWQVTSATSCRPSPGASGVDEVVTSRIFTHPGGTTVDHLEKDDTNYTGLPARVCAGAGTQAR